MAGTDVSSWFSSIKDEVYWKDLASFLDFTPTDIKSIELENADDKSRCMDMLEKWQMREKRAATKEVLMKALSEAKLHVVADDLNIRYPDASRYFDFIKENACTGWRDLAYTLGVRETEIKRIEARNPDDKSRCMDMLEQWRRRNGKGATKEVLMQALFDAGLHDTLDDLYKSYPDLKDLVPTIPWGYRERVKKDEDTRRYFDFIAEDAAMGWEDLAHYLEVGWPGIDRIKARNPDDKSRCMDMLDYWRQRNGKGATVEVLMDALSEAGLHDTLGGLEQEYSELRKVVPTKPRDYREPVENAEDASRYFDFIKENASKDWENLASCLGVEWTEIERIEASNPDDQSRCMDMLEQWRRQNGKRATVEVLIGALFEAALHDALDRLKYEYPDPGYFVYPKSRGYRVKKAKAETHGVKKAEGPSRTPIELQGPDVAIYAEACRHGSQPVFSLQVPVAGQVGSGKTCFINRLVGETQRQDKPITEKIPIVSDASLPYRRMYKSPEEAFRRRSVIPGGVKGTVKSIPGTGFTKDELGTAKYPRLTFLELGSEATYGMHPSITHRGVCILVMSLLQKLDPPSFLRKASGKKEMTGRVTDYLDHWLSSILHHTKQRTASGTEPSSTSPPFLSSPTTMQPSGLIVLTHKDEVSKQYILKYKRKIRTHIRGKATGKLVLPDIFAVDNTDENPLSICPVREYIRKVARDLPHMGERIPNSWLHLRSKLTTKIKKGDAVWKFEDVAKLARDPDINITDRGTLSRVLSFLHDRGDIIFLRDPTLGGDVTLQPPLVALEEHQAALQFQEVCPEMTEDKRWSAHLPRGGKYLCKRTDLGVVTPYPLHVTYRSANWSDRWQRVEEWMPVGPLFSIQCEDVKGSVDILLPHVLHGAAHDVAEGSEMTTEDLQVVHVVGEFRELLPVTELTNSHAVIRFKKGSDFGLVGRTEKVSNVVRSGLLMAFRSLEDSDLSVLKVYIVSNCRAVKEVTERDETELMYAHCDTTPCQLYRGRRYYLEGRVTDGEDIRVKIHPPFLTFEDTLDTNRVYAPFRVEVSQNLWSDTTARLHLQLLEEIDDHTKEAVSELILGRYKRQEGTDSGHSTPTELQGPPLDTPISSVDVDDVFGKVVSSISDKWKDLARKLGFESAVINEIEVTQSLHGPKDKCREVLDRWLNKKANEATLQALKKALIKIDQKRTAQSL